jgi:hypothetical protein
MIYYESRLILCIYTHNILECSINIYYGFFDNQTDLRGLNEV